MDVLIRAFGAAEIARGPVMPATLPDDLDGDAGTVAGVRLKRTVNRRFAGLRQK